MSGYAEGEHTGPVNVPVPQHDMCVTPYHKVVSHSGWLRPAMGRCSE